MTLSVLLFTFLFGSCLGGIEVPRDFCEWKVAHYGSFATCDGDEIAVGGCGSGHDPRCDGKWSGLLCCRMPGYYSSDCTLKGEDWGRPVQCGEGGHDIVEKTKFHRLWGKSVEAVCGSGTGKDCDGLSHQVNCCQGHYEDSLVGNTDQCTWLYTAVWGGKLECSRNDEVVMGVCQSGENRDCPGDAVHGILCCELDVVA